MKNIRVKVVNSCTGGSWWFGICQKRTVLMDNVKPQLSWVIKDAAIRNAKAMAKRIGIPYDPEIVKQHGC